MIDAAHEPRTLQEAILYFSDPDNCVRYVVARRWPNGVSCPTCGGEAKLLATQRVWQCKKQHPHRQFSVKVGTVMEDSAIKLDKWLTAMWMLVNCKNGISSYEVARDLGISQKSAWHLMHRIRLAAQDEVPRKMAGHVEVDETFIGGKARNMHVDKRRRRITGTGGKDKVVVFGALERGGRVRASVVADRRKKGLHGSVRKRCCRQITPVGGVTWRAVASPQVPTVHPLRCANAADSNTALCAAD